MTELRERIQRLADFIEVIDPKAKFDAAKRLAQCGTDEEAQAVLEQIAVDCEDYFPKDTDREGGEQ